MRRALFVVKLQLVVWQQGAADYKTGNGRKVKLRCTGSLIYRVQIKGIFCCCMYVCVCVVVLLDILLVFSVQSHKDPEPKRLLRVNLPNPNIHHQHLQGSSLDSGKFLPDGWRLGLCDWPTVRQSVWATKKPIKSQPIKSCQTLHQWLYRYTSLLHTLWC